MGHFRGFVIVIITLLSCFSMAQTPYRKMIVEGNRWAVDNGTYSCSGYCNTSTMWIAGDTVIGNVAYKKARGKSAYITVCGSNPWLLCENNVTGPGYAGAFIEDSITRKVYYYNSSTGTDDLLYDFDLQVGDTLPQTIGINNLPNQPNLISKIDSLQIGSVWYRTFFIDSFFVNETMYPVLIEGVGMNFGYWPGYYIPFEGMSGLNCFNGNRVCFEAFCGSFPIPNCYPSALGIADHLNNDAINVFPNPSSGDFLIESNIPAEWIYVFDISGKKIMHVCASVRETKVDLKSMPAGIYLLQLIQEGVVVGSKKLIVD